MAGSPWSNQAISLIILTEATTGFSGMFGYSPTVGTGNLIFSIAAAAGVDPYGNAYPQGISGFGTLTLFGPTAALLIYSGTPANGNLIGSWAGQAGVDSFGNAYPTGINVSQGILQGVTITSSTITDPNITDGTATNLTLSVPTIAGGFANSTDITFTQGSGGQLLVYTSSTSTVTQTANGSYTFTAPAGVSQALIEVTGAGAGAGGGSATRGGEGGGGGEYAAEPAYPLVPGQVYNYQVGQGGSGGVTGVGGNTGGDSFFDFGGAAGGVIAEGGQAGSGFVGGTGGQYGLQTVSWPGGTGGGNGSQSTGGCGGGGSAGSTSGGGSGTTSGSSTGTAGGAAGSGTTPGAKGGNGGNNGANGNNGASPGAAGGGCGSGSSTNSFTKVYHLSNSQTFLGNGSQRGTSTMYQGGETAGGGSSNGIMCSMGLWPFSTIESDLSGATITSVSLRLENLHSWNNSGMNVVLGYTSNSSIPSTYNGASTNILNSSIAEGATKNFSLPASYGTALKNGTAKTIIIGPGPGNISNPNLAYYGYFYGFGGDNNQNPQLTIQGTTGAGSNQAGSGADGQVKITYSSAQVLVASISPIAGTDTFGNQFPEGIAGIDPTASQYVAIANVSTYSPSAIVWGPLGSAADTAIVRNGAGSLAVDADVLIPTGSQLNFAAGGQGPFIIGEGFHAVALNPTGSVSGTCRVKLLPWNAVWLDAEISVTTSVATTYTLGTLPGTAYYPVVARRPPASYTGSITSTGSQFPRFFIPTSGSIQIIIPGGGVGTFSASVIYPNN